MPTTKQAPKGVYEKVKGSGEWWILYHVNGVRRREKVGPKAAAITLYQKRKTEAAVLGKMPELKPRKATTVADLLDLVLEYTVDHRSKSDYVTRARIVRETLGKMEAEDLTPQMLERWLKQHCGTPATSNRYKAFFSLAYRLGMNNQLVETNPARLIRQKHEANGRIRFLTKNEYDKLCDIIRQKYPQHLAEFIVSVRTGMRRSELYGATWGMYDPERRSIDLSRVKNDRAGQQQGRTVQLTADVVELLNTIKPENAKLSARIFYRKGAQDNRFWFTPCLKEAGIKDYVWHCNRHTFCSWLAMAGATMKEIMTLAGHKTIQMASRYSHLSPDHNLSVLDRI